MKESYRFDQFFIQNDSFLYVMKLGFNLGFLSNFTITLHLVYEYRDGAFYGANESMFTPTLKFILDKVIDEHALVIQETMEKNGKKTFGYDEPIIYRRVQHT